MLDQQDLPLCQILDMNPEEYSDISLSELSFSYRTSARLTRKGIKDIGELLSYTPESLLAMSGFGVGCLNEVENQLNELKASHLFSSENMPIESCTSKIPEANTYGSQFNLDPVQFHDISIDCTDFTPRFQNICKRNGVKTLEDLLNHSPDSLKKLRGFGDVMLLQISQKLPFIVKDLSSKPFIFTQIFVPEISIAENSESIINQYRDQIIHGDFSFIEENNIPADAQKTLRAIMAAENDLDPFLQSECLSNSSAVHEIIQLCHNFLSSGPNIANLKALMEEIPETKRKKYAAGFIMAYTRAEGKKLLLNIAYPSPNATLDSCLNLASIDPQLFSVLQNFLNWCKFDISAEIEQLFSLLYSTEREHSVIHLRANHQTLEQVGKQHKITRERVRQLEKKIQRHFNNLFARSKLLLKINAELNNPLVISASDIAEFCPAHADEFIYLVRGCESSQFTSRFIYDKTTDTIILGGEDVKDRISAFVDTLPEVIAKKDIEVYYETANTEFDLSPKIVEKAIEESYNKTGEVYHRTSLTLAALYTEILQSYYPDGIYAYDEDELDNFRTYASDIYGITTLPSNNRALTARISGICVLCGKGKYCLKKKHYISKSLANRIYKYIQDSDHDIFMTNSLFTVFENDLISEGVDNKYYLQGILHELFGEEFTFSRDYLSKDPSITSIYSSIISFIKKHKYPVSKEDIVSEFPGLPEISLNIAVESPEIINFFGQYVHASNLDLTLDEKLYLSHLVHNVVADKAPHHGREFFDIIQSEQPLILSRNGAAYPFAVFSILQYMFKDKYQFSRPYIAKLGVQIDRPGDQLRELIYTHDEYRISDIRDFCKANRFSIQSTLEFLDSCNDEYLIANSEKIIRIDKLGITPKIAKQVEETILHEITSTVPICQLRCWEQFPRLSSPWSDWLVYSVIRKWSTSLDAGVSNNQLKYAIPLVAPAGKLSSAEIDGVETDNQIYQADDLDNIDDLLGDILSEDPMEGFTWN